jgi:histidinol phosphatase-like PHP family hydrolase
VKNREVAATRVEHHHEPIEDADAIGAAIERGVMLVLNIDSHAADQIGGLMRYAVGTARRGGATAASVLNARDYEGLRRWLHYRK